MKFAIVQFQIQKFLDAIIIGEIMSKKPKKKKEIRLDKQTSINNVVINTLPPLKFKSGGFFIDLTFEGLYYSVDVGKFYNFLKDQEEFIKKFFQIRGLINKLKNKEFVADLIINSGMTHCHVIADGKRDLVLDAIEKSLISYDKNKNYEKFMDEIFGEEKIYQIGFDKSIRLIGTYDESYNIFRIYLIDYHHLVFPDKKRNNKNKRNYNYCPMKSCI